MKEILIAHSHRYPKMEPTDAVKLIYQNEFGGGHLIRDEESCLDYLRREYGSVQPNRGVSLAEDIGGGLIRVNLAALPAGELDRLGQAFLRSARLCQGSLPSFLDKLELLRQLTGEGSFAFSLPTLEAYLQGYAQAGYPMVSHSEAYRNAYHPAYRVVRADLF